LAGPYNVLFICSGNSARSIMAEAIMNSLGRGHYRAFSAGSQPTGAVHPMTLEVLEKAELPTQGLRSKSWAEFCRPGAPHLHFVFTVCDRAHGEVCPAWPGQPITAHWGFQDPALVVGPPVEQERAFARVFAEISNRIRLFLSLPIDGMDRLAMKREVDAIGVKQLAVSQQD
jgi:arsenate reductase